jgi:hypothetical protein
MLLALAALFASPYTSSADPLKVDRTLQKEPAYSTKAPRYGLLVFGPSGQHRVWLVHDGDALFVDRNCNGDLTEPGEKVPAEKPREGSTREEGEYVFELGELRVGGRTHKGVTVLSSRLANFGSPSIAGRPDVKAALAKDPKTEVVVVRGDIDFPGMKGGGLDGRLSFMAGFFDLAGLLQFAAKPADAPVIHLGGPLEITFFAELPTLRVGRESELILVVGTPGVGPGTFAMLHYEDTIPESARPVAEITYQPAAPGAKPLKELFEIKDRC